MGPVEDCLLGLLVEHLQLDRVPGGPNVIIRNLSANLLFGHVVLIVEELPLHEENFLLHGPLVV